MVTLCQNLIFLCQSKWKTPNSFTGTYLQGQRIHIKYFDSIVDTEGHGDAPAQGLGFSLLQNDMPIIDRVAFYRLQEKRYFQIEKELLQVRASVLYSHFIFNFFN